MRRNEMFYGHITTPHGSGEIHTINIYFDWAAFHKDMFNPESTGEIIRFEVNGKTYAERKESVRNTAIEWSYADKDGLSIAEFMVVEDWFYKNGKRYGLLGEFRENAIC